MQGTALGFWIFLVGLPIGALDLLLLVACLRGTRRAGEFVRAVAILQIVLLGLIGLALLGPFFECIEDPDTIQTAIAHVASIGVAVAFVFGGRNIIRRADRMASGVVPNKSG